MIEYISQWITDNITGDESMTSLLVIIFIVGCFIVSGSILNKTLNKEQSGIYIGTPEQQPNPNNL